MSITRIPLSATAVLLLTMSIAVVSFLGASSLFTYRLLSAGLVRNPGAQASEAETSPPRQDLSPPTPEATSNAFHLFAEVLPRPAQVSGSPPQETLLKALERLLSCFWEVQWQWC